METFHLKGRVTESGELEIDLPEGLTPGEVDVTIKVLPHEEKSFEDRPWTDEEIQEMLRPHPKTGAEIVAAGHTGGWEHYGITDGGEWVKEQRRKRREKRGW